MDVTPEQEPERVLDWPRLGAMIADARRRRGWDQAELAQRSGNSPNTISNYERGRPIKSRRIPGGIKRVEFALGWPAGTAEEILHGGAHEQPTLFKELGTAESKESAQALTGTVGIVAPSPIRRPFEDVELTQSGHLAQDVFLRQAKRYRKLRGVSIEELVERIGDLGADLSAGDIGRLEAGTRLLRMAEAKVIAKALETTVDWLLGSGFSDEAPEEMRWPPDDKEMEAEANAVMRRMAEVGAQLNAAHQQAAMAKEREAQARAEADMAMAMIQSVMAQQREMEKHYQYLLGRIDSIRAARGEETAIQFHPVHEDDEEQSEEKPQPRPAHTASRNKAGLPYPGSKAQQEEDLAAAARRLV